LGTRWRITPKIEGARIAKSRRDCPTTILKPEECISQAIKKFSDGVAVAWSGGRCSTVVLHMALKQKPDIKVLWNNTGVEFPETVKFVRSLTENWKLGLVETISERTFWECVDLYGFPMFRGQYTHGKLTSKEGKPMCCKWLKEDPMRNAMLRHRIYAVITGIRACESRARMFGISQYGQYYYAKTMRMWRFHPIAFWDTYTLSRYIEENGLPLNEIYSMGHDRCGCWPCTGYVTWKESLAKSHPKMYQALARMKGEPTLWEYADTEGCRQEAEPE